jgi:hypothetical protein
MERCRNKTVVVLPAFETEEFPGSVEEKHLKTAHKVSAATVKSDKRTVLSAMVAQGLVHQFDKYTHLAVSGVVCVAGGVTLCVLGGRLGVGWPKGCIFHEPLAS